MVEIVDYLETLMGPWCKVALSSGCWRLWFEAMRPHFTLLQSRSYLCTLFLEDQELFGLKSAFMILRVISKKSLLDKTYFF